MMRHTVPVTVLTGFLGAGKTTLVNRLLGEAHGRRFAVIENEFGAVNVDAELLLETPDETLVQLSNGCVCCTVRGDLARALGELAAAREAGRVAFDHVLLETSGLADPGPIVRTFLAETALLTKFHLDGVVALFDALNGERTLEEAVEAGAQLGYADAILVTKPDLVDRGALDARCARLGALNRAAHVAVLDVPRAPWGEIFEKLLALRGYQFDRVEFVPEPTDVTLRSAPAAHTVGVGSVALRAARPLDGVALNRGLASLQARYGERLWRLKGVLAIEGLKARVVVQGVQGLVQANTAALWRPYEPRRSVLVVIGRDLDADEVVRAFAPCGLAPPQTGGGEGAPAGDRAPAFRVC
ncbi:MAG: GTP-binding protein [Gammaproteobacteria bacterium]|nr:GTP-binding protein [Gammaproteobacteria bacterium]